MGKKILVFGAGAVGSFYGGLLKKAGFDVDFVARGNQLKALKSQGGVIIKSFRFGQEFIPLMALSEVTEKYDIIIISVKSQDTEDACKKIKNYLKSDGFVVSMQNGVDNIKIIKEYFGIDKSVAVSVFVGAYVGPAGTVNHDAAGRLIVGGFSEQSDKNAEEFIKLFTYSGVECQKSSDIMDVIWKKLIWNVAFNPISALLEATCGKLSKNEDSRFIMNKMIAECARAAAIDGVKITEEYAKSVPEMIKGLENYKTSMLQDIQKGKKPEIDGILLPVIDRLKDDAPYCKTVYSSLKFKYSGHFIYPPRLASDVIVYNSKDEVLLIERKNEPYGWAIPGGFVDYGEKVENAAVRELAEETGIKLSVEDITLLGIYSDPKRDKRGHTVTAVYYGFSDEKPVASDDAKNAAFYTHENLPEQIAFDHGEVLNDFFKKRGVQYGA